ncbi:ubiquitin-related domain-containing protein [Zopfochytrium polystomum]|nr:ubiquitin-related domain-containing protein [Zopfochytrium polystomum]
MPSDRQTLIDMGFSEAKVTRALKATKNAGLQPAMDWLFAHADEPDDVADEPAAAADAPADDGEISAEQATAASLKCDDCGRLLRDATSAEAHAIKTGHQNFSESVEQIKPLTEEEKAAKLAELKARLAARKEEKRLQEIAESKSREQVRRKTGQELTELKEKHKEIEMKKQLEEKRREKEAEKIAKAKIRAQIEADKKDRAARIEKEKLERQGLSTQAAAVSASSSTTSLPAASSSAPKEYAEARIQFRLSTGSVLTQTFKSDDVLDSLFTFVSEKTGASPGSFKIFTPFPKVELVDRSATLKDLKLVPSSALAVVF